MTITNTFLNAKMVENTAGDPEGFVHATSNGFAVVNFTGQLLFAGTQIIDWFNISGATTGNIWLNGNTTFRGITNFFPVINSTSDAAVQTMNWDYNPDTVGISRYTDIGTASATFTRQMYSQARAEYVDLAPMARRTNQTDVLIEDTFFEKGAPNLGVTP